MPDDATLIPAASSMQLLFLFGCKENPELNN